MAELETASLGDSDSWIFDLQAFLSLIFFYFDLFIYLFIYLFVFSANALSWPRTGAYAAALLAPLGSSLKRSRQG
jgi:hypothetical protein